MKNMAAIKRNINAVEQTRQITNAMYLLSASETRKAMLQINYNKRFVHSIREAVRNIVIDAEGEGFSNQYLETKPTGRAAFLVISSDKGLCGSYNYNICDCLSAELAKFENPYVGSAGTCGSAILRQRGIRVDTEWDGIVTHPSVHVAEHIAEHFINMFNNREISELYVVYTHFKSQILQFPTCRRLLPLIPEDFSDVTERSVDLDMIYEPSISGVFDILVPQYIIGYIFGRLMQSMLCENSARMNAMQNSTRNADEMLKKLNFEYNTVRQLAITNEITEIAAAVEVFNHKSV